TPTPDLARDVLGRLYPTAELHHPCALDAIKATASAALDVPLAALLAHDRRPKVAFARQVAMYLARELTDETLPAIGRTSGGRNHSTVLHAHQRIARAVLRDERTAAIVDGLRQRLTRASDDRH